MRAARIAFQGDAHVLAAAQLQIRQTFQENRALEASKVYGAVQHAEDVARILRENVVQGKRVGADGEEHFKLRIHEHTERGDNESILTAGKDSKGGCGCR
ncbi:Mitochondrial zinc maintenance protein 1 [Escovopsis weberi]|uniref:Mitochondrial zinc maintenance protein 1, mitochondrial n=1 Tax=Escovopsis weberi TaxID=150374 RepID=A0A0M9VTK8_ESCWE|nr:Mitochondrial zinc maintenance protein 1 [Escovopsis weberi]